MLDKEIHCYHKDSFENDINMTWQRLQKEKYFCDVTLVCDGKAILTHKIILSSSSIVFRDILKLNSFDHPVIFVPRVKLECIQNLLNFMYQGVINVDEEDLSDFLKVAEDLKVKGLFGKNEEASSKRFSRETLHDNIKSSPSKQNHIENVPEIISTDPKKVNLKDEQFITHDVKEKIENVNQLVKTENKSQAVTITNAEKLYTCDICYKRYTLSNNLRTHKVSAHFGKKYPCDQCDISPFSYSFVLKQHKLSVHDGVTYACDLCGISPFARPGSLRKHKASVHDGIRYFCDLCNSKPYSQMSVLKQHKQAVHEGVRYPCKFCDISPFARSNNLKHHIASAHDGIFYECSECDYKATMKGALYKHMKNVHKF